LQKNKNKHSPQNFGKWNIPLKIPFLKEKLPNVWDFNFFGGENIITFQHSFFYGQSFTSFLQTCCQSINVKSFLGCLLLMQIKKLNNNKYKYNKFILKN
jgi:hypothetical protein